MKNLPSPQDFDLDLDATASYAPGAAALPETTDLTSRGTLHAARPLPQVPGHEILKEIGRGGMGIVYLARETAVGNRAVALKLLRVGPATPSQWVSRFRAEIAAAANLEHPHLVRLYGAGECPDGLYFTMEYVAGKSLEKVIASRPGAFSPHEAASLLAKLARAIAFTHAKGIVHRDLTPGNVLLTDAGDPKITDFGLAKTLGDDTTRTRAGQVVGTPHYMAPEMAEGDAHTAGPPADVYGLGAVLYVLLTGVPPFHAETILDLMHAVIYRPPVRPRTLQTAISRDLETICLKCLEKKPAKRYPSALALAEDLERFLAGRPILARRIGPAGRALRWTKREPLRAALLGVILLAAGLGGGLLWHRGQSSGARKQAATARAEAEQDSYAARISQADAAWEANAVDRAAAILDECPAELRGWEWRYLHRQCRGARQLFRAHQGPVWSCRFTRLGDVLLSAGSGPVTLAWWDPATVTSRRDRGGAATGVIRSLVVRGDGETVATAGDDGTVRVWSLNDGSLGATFQVPGLPPIVGLAATGRQGVVIGSLPGTALLWDGGAEATSRSFSHGSTLLALATTPAGDLLATGGADGTVKLWTLATGELRATLQGHTAAVRALAFSAEGRTLASGGDDATAVAWEVAHAAEIRRFRGHDGAIRALAFTPDRQLISAGEDRVIRLWDTTSGDIARTFRGHAQTVTTLDVRTDGRIFASGSTDGSICLWEMEGESPTALRGHLGVTTCVAVSARGELAATGSTDGTLRLWDTTTWTPRGSYVGHRGEVTGLALSPDGLLLASGSDDGFVAVCTNGGTNLWSHAAHRGGIRKLALDPTGKLLATGGDDGTVKLWTLATGELRATLHGHTAAVRALAFSTDGGTLASGGIGRSVVLWDVATGTDTRQFPTAGETAWSLCLSAGGLLAVGGTGVIQLWKVTTGEPVGTLTAHGGSIRALACTDEGKRLFSGGPDALVKVWELPSGRELLSLRGSHGPVTDLALAPEGSFLLSTSQQKSAWLWRAP